MRFVIQRVTEATCEVDQKSKPEIRNLQTISTNILLQNAKKKFRMYKPESLVQI